MTTQTSQPNGDGQLLRGAPALRAAARNALTARGPVEPVDPAETVEPVDSTEPVRPVEPIGWNETGWHQNVRLLAGPPDEPDPPHEGEPPGGVATAERVDVFVKRPAQEELPAEPEVDFGSGPDACYGGTVAGAPVAAGVVEWTPAEGETDSARAGEPVPAAGAGCAPPVVGASPGAVGVDSGESAGSDTAPSQIAYAGAETGPEREPAGDVLESVRTVTDEPGAPAAPEPTAEAADVPHSRGECWALPPKFVFAGAAVEPAEPEAEVEVEAETDGPSDETDADAPASSGIPAPVWDVSVPTGSGAVVPTRASVTFDSHRWSPLIVGEATHEIPVHLLFRDDEVTIPATAPAAGRPRIRPSQPVPDPVTPPPLAPAATSRPATPVDTKLVERPGPTLPGWMAALVGLAALFGCVTVLWWVGAVPEALTEMFGLGSNPYNGIGIGKWTLLAVGLTLTLFAFGGLGRGRVGHAWVLTLFGEYRGSVRRTGLLWVSPLLLRRRVDVRLRHWRSEPMPAVDANGTALRVVVLVVWRVRDTVRAALGVADHEEYLREQVEAAMARVLSQLPADAFNEAAPTLRNAEVVGEALTRMLSAECRPVGLDVFSAQPTRIEYAPEISAAMQRSRIAAIDARHRDTVLTSVVDAVDDTVHRLTSRGLVELDDYERKVLVKDLTVAFYTGRHGLNEGN
ncbi:SPFH domain-containing protein [Streptomyces sp. NPDC050428]|uniref:SPFH domain-containing protein n=1 Tax=Streptomyces sp. NPDC050428 TaxID=3155757 RepID=UPI00341B2F9A